MKHLSGRGVPDLDRAVVGAGEDRVDVGPGDVDDVAEMTCGQRYIAFFSVISNYTAIGVTSVKVTRKYAYSGINQV